MGDAAKSLSSAEVPLTGPVPLTFDEVYSQHFAFVWRSLQRLGVASAVLEDAAQDTFVVVHRRLGDLRADASVKAFLFGTALRVAQNYRRTARRKGAASLDTENAHSLESSPFERTAANRALAVVDEFVATLDDDKRMVFVLSALEQMTAPEIARALSIPLNTAYSRLRIARERFVAFVAQRGDPHA